MHTSHFPWLILLLATIALTAGCLGEDAQEPQELEADEATLDEGATSHAVLAFIDTGINPYHEDFRAEDERYQQHPSTYLPDYPEDAQRLELTFDHDELEDAVQADCEEWENVEPDTLYYVPGTRVIGAIFIPTEYQSSPGAPEDFSCDGEVEWPMFIDGGGHGTMVASRGAGNAHGACSSCLIVAVEAFGAESVEWTANQPWIDLQSNSWGPIAPIYDPTGLTPTLTGSTPSFIEAVENASNEQPSFWASGNGLLFRFGVAGHPTQAAPHMTPSVIRVGGHDSGYVNTWPGSSPHVISDSCWAWAAENYSMNETPPRTAGGTSGATPFVAGIAGQTILEARTLLGHASTGVDDGSLAQGPQGLVDEGPLSDGAFTMDDLRDVLFKTADPRPDRIQEDGDVCTPTEMPGPYATTPIAWEDVPEGPHGIPFVGYGAVTPYTFETIQSILHGDAPLPERPHEETFFDADDDARETTYDAYTLPND